MSDARPKHARNRSAPRAPFGKGRNSVLTCHLTKKYVAINGDYRS
jgi:hypothetical protein